ncbi:bone morphogenetic protein 15 [Ascaphus truei]|uniref:bone morphogenetic protein 15 n=1 Tax=Ascaphus truei TaxID=8439 RepID=UPI003F5AADBB
MTPGLTHRLLLFLLFLTALTPPAARGNGGRALERSPSLPLIRALLEHGPIAPRRALKQELSPHHLRFMLELYRRSADGDGRPRVGRQAGPAVRLVRPVGQSSLSVTGSWHVQTLKFNLQGMVDAQRLVRATVMYPLGLFLGDTRFFCKVDLLPNEGLNLNSRVPARNRKWAETDLTFHLQPLVEEQRETLNFQLQLMCRKAGRSPRKPVAVSSSHVPFLLLYLNHTLQSSASEDTVVSSELGKGIPGLLTRKPRQAGTIGIKLPRYFNQSRQAKNQCVLRPLWISFHQLGWDHWIIAPHRYNPGYCKGDCPRLLHSGYNSPNHAIIQNFINQLVDGNVPRPSCVPYAYGPISVLMIEPGGNILYKEYENMMAESCTCR